MVSISKTKSNGRVIRAYAGIDPATGKRITVSKTLPYGATKEEVAEARAWVEMRAGRARRAGSMTTIGLLVDYYLDGLATDGKSPTTEAAYRSMTRTYIKPYIWDLQIEKAHASDFARLYRHLLAAGGKDGQPLSAATVQKLHAFLSGCFGRLRKDGMIEVSPLADVRPPSGHSPEAVPLSEVSFTELRTYLLNALADTQAEYNNLVMTTAIWTALHTGSRRGEICGWQLRDFRQVGADHELRIARTLIQLGRSGGNLRYKDPKSRAGKRSISLDEQTVTIISEHLARQERELSKRGIRMEPTTPLFATSDGTPIKPNTLTEYFRSVANELKLPKCVHLHTLRHTHATYLLEHGTNIKTVQERLGHSKIDVTLGTYGHVLPGRDKQAAHDFGEVSKSMVNQTYTESSATWPPPCPLSGKTCVRYD